MVEGKIANAMSDLILAHEIAKIEMRETERLEALGPQFFADVVTVKARLEVALEDVRLCEDTLYGLLPQHFVPRRIVVRSKKVG